jgi:hypothetical protein
MSMHEARSSVPHNGVVNSVPEVVCYTNLICPLDLFQKLESDLITPNEQSEDKLNGVMSAPTNTQINNDVVVGLNQSNKSYDSISLITNDVIDIVETIEQPLDGVANVVHEMSQKKSRPTEEEVIAFGGIAPTTARSSARLQRKDNADDDALAKAMKLAQNRAPPMVTGTHTNLSFVDKDSSEIIELAAPLGVSLGKNIQDAVKTVDNMKRVEESRNIQFLQKKVLIMSLKGMMVPQIC